MKEKIFNAKSVFNVIVYSMLAWTILSAVYVSLPVEYQDMLPFMNTGTAIIGGATTLLTGSGGLAVQHFLRKTKTYNQDLNKSLVDKVLFIIDEYKIMEEKTNELTNTTKINNELLRTELKTKLDNPMLTETARKLIEDVLRDEE